jgi:hypothetical protein
MVRRLKRMQDSRFDGYVNLESLRNPRVFFIIKNDGREK